jgi:hypothetical protein
MTTNRIGESCWWQFIQLRQGINEFRRGRILAWSTDFEDLQDGKGQYPVAIIEDLESGKVHSIPVELIRFCEHQPNTVET